MYSIKNLKTLQGREGIAFTATLYRDGVKAALCSNDGNGGMSRIDWVDGKGAWVSRDYATEQEALFAAWVRENASGSWIHEFLDESDWHAAELGVDMLVDREAERRTMARHAKTKVLFRLPGDPDDGSCRTLKHMGEPLRAAAWIRGKYPEAVLWDPEQERWAS